MRDLLIAAALAASAAPVPVLAADAATLACLTADIDPAVPRGVASQVAASMEKGELPEKDPVNEAVVGQALICKSRHHWSDAAFEAAITHAIALFASSGIEAALSRHGFDPGAVVGAFRSLPADVRASFQAEPIPDGTIDAYLQAVEKAGVVSENELHVVQISMLAAMLSVAESERMKFVSE